MGSVLVQLLPGLPWAERIAQLDGEVVRLFVGSYSLDPPDPAMLFSDLGHQVANATCAGLLRRNATTSSEGAQFEPEVAAAMPTVSDGGRTYSFTIRSGYRFSPPSGEELTADTFRYTIERALSPRLGPDAPGPRIISDIEGQEAFSAGEEEHISGLRVEGDVLTITLASPSGDFLDRVASPVFCPVPVGTPAIAGGLSVPFGGEDPQEIQVPAAGPYYISRFLNGEYAILSRNPNYSGPRPHRFDAIVLREGIDPVLAGELVESGQWDGITNMFDGDGPVEDVFAPRIGCVTDLPDGDGVDLAALCLAESS